MTPQKSVRIALTDKSLLETLRVLHNEPEYVWSALESLGDLVGKVDFFLLDDDTAIRFLGTRPENDWPSVVVVAKDGQSVPAAYQQGLVDDIIVWPVRALDIERILRNHEYLQALRNLEDSSRGVADLVKQVQEDLNLAQKIQRRLIREKFPALGPLSVKSKYWCGLKSGGDYFDLFEFPGNSHAGLILSDSSSYSLSTNLIGSLMQFSVHVAQEDIGNPQRIVQTLFGKLKDTMKEKDKLSLLYGVLDRKTYCLRYVNVGGVYLAKRGKDGKVLWGSRGEHPPLALDQQKVPEVRELSLEPGDRLLVCSDGWSEALDQPMALLMESFLNEHQDAQDLMNDLAFRLRKKLESSSEEPLSAEDEFPMPPQDCSVLLMDLAANVLRLAR